jgi:hypothetical protein
MNPSLQDCPNPACPLDDPNTRRGLEVELAAKIESVVAERVFPKKWITAIGYIGTLCLGAVLAMAVWLYNIDRNNTNSRLIVVESFVTEQRAINSRREEILVEIRKRLESIDVKLDRHENETDRQVKENAVMIRQILERMRARS